MLHREKWGKGEGEPEEDSAEGREGEVERCSERWRNTARQGEGELGLRERKREGENRPG